MARTWVRICACATREIIMVNVFAQWRNVSVLMGVLNLGTGPSCQCFADRVMLRVLSGMKWVVTYPLTIGAWRAAVVALFEPTYFRITSTVYRETCGVRRDSGCQLDLYGED